MNRTFQVFARSAVLVGAIAIFAAAQAPPAHTSRHGARPDEAAPGAPSHAAAPQGTAIAARPAVGGNAVMPASAYSTVPVKKTPAGEQFFIVASLDLQQKQLLLKYPTEVTLLVKVTDQTAFVDDSGKSMKLSDLRAGDTVWLTSSGSSTDTTALKVRKGEMTVADLHRYYLDYSEIK
ncbi:MAG: hypothetical protein WCC21_17545 [Candidatus Acidiferrales bacterium]